MRDTSWTCKICGAERESRDWMIEHLKASHNIKYIREKNSRIIKKRGVILADRNDQLTLII